MTIKRIKKPIWDGTLEDAELTWEGRKNCDAAELHGGYCGSISLDGHLRQLKDPECWVQGCIPRWRLAASPKYFIMAELAKLEKKAARLQERLHELEEE